MRTWQDIYDTIAEDATIQKAICNGPGLMCVLGGLASNAGLDVEARWEAWKNHYQAGFPIPPKFVDTAEAIAFIVEHYPLDGDQCVKLFEVNDKYITTSARRKALIKKVKEFETQQKESN